MLHPRDPCPAKPLTLDWVLIFAGCTALRWSADGFSDDGQHCITQVRSAGKFEDQQYECTSDRPCLMPNSWGVRASFIIYAGIRPSSLQRICPLVHIQRSVCRPVTRLRQSSSHQRLYDTLPPGCFAVPESRQEEEAFLPEVSTADAHRCSLDTRQNPCQVQDGHQLVAQAFELLTIMCALNVFHMATGADPRGCTTGHQQEYRHRRVGAQASLVSALVNSGNRRGLCRHCQYNLWAFAGVDGRSRSPHPCVVVCLPCSISCRIQGLHVVPKNRGKVSTLVGRY